jgi:hypothetical protein
MASWPPYYKETRNSGEFKKPLFCLASCLHGFLIIKNPGTQEKFKISLPNSWLHGLLIIRKPGIQEFIYGSLS